MDGLPITLQKNRKRLDRGDEARQILVENAEFGEQNDQAQIVAQRGKCCDLRVLRGEIDFRPVEGLPIALGVARVSLVEGGGTASPAAMKFM